MSLAKRYTREIRKQLKRFAAWEPGTPLQLGDYGQLDGALFQRIGNVSQLGVAFSALDDGTSDRISYASKGAVDFSTDLDADADVPAAVRGKAALKVSFKTESAVMFNAADVHFEAMADQRELGRQILELYAEGEWDARHSIIVELSRAGSTTVIISAGSSASILLVAEGDVPNVDLADASLKIAPSVERNIGYKAIAEAGMTPLFGLARVKPRGLFWWRRPEFRRQMGFKDLGEGVGPTKDFERSLDRDLEALREQARADGVDFGEAFEWAGQQPVERPEGEAR